MTNTRRILVVEDDAAVRGVVSRHLRGRGFEVTEAGTAEEALLRAGAGGCCDDLVITDVHMPGLSGVELARLLLANAPFRPVLVMTGDADEALARTALREGAAGYLLKPFELFELDALINQSITRLELLEAAEALARADRERTRTQTRDAFLPPAWLELADLRSSAGLGHGYRVARIAAAIAAAYPDGFPSGSFWKLEPAARGHELGRLFGASSEPVDIALKSAEFLLRMGFQEEIATAVRHMPERWDGQGGPHGLVSTAVPPASLTLACADAVDHGAVQRIETAATPAEAVAVTIDELLRTGDAVFGPAVTLALEQARPIVEAIWTLTRASATPSEASSEERA